MVLAQHVDQLHFFERHFGTERKNWTWADIGACRGDTIKMFLHFIPQGHGEAFEPNPMNAQFLAEASVRLDNVKINNVAVGKKNEKVKFFFKKSDTAEQRFDNHYTGSIREEDFKETDVHECEVDCITLDSHYEGRPIDFIKLDVEGTEWEVLEGATSLLKRDIVWQIEFHKPEDWHKRQMLYDFGYEIYDLNMNLLPRDCEMEYQTVVKRPNKKF